MQWNSIVELSEVKFVDFEENISILNGNCNSLILTVCLHSHQDTNRWSDRDNDRDGWRDSRVIERDSEWRRGGTDAYVVVVTKLSNCIALNEAFQLTIKSCIRA